VKSQKEDEQEEEEEKEEDKDVWQILSQVDIMKLSCNDMKRLISQLVIHAGIAGYIK